MFEKLHAYTVGSFSLSVIEIVGFKKNNMKIKQVIHKSATFRLLPKYCIYDYESERNVPYLSERDILVPLSPEQL